MDLISACDFQEIDNVNKILNNYKIDTNEINLSLDISIGNKNLQILEILCNYILKNKIKLIEKIDDILQKECFEGINIRLICLLQKYCSSEILAKLFRFKPCINFYIFGPSEELKFKEISFFFNKIKKSVKNFDNILKIQRKINDYFVDSYKYNHRLILIDMLNKSILPTQNTIDQILYDALYNNNISLIEMIFINSFEAQKFSFNINNIFLTLIRETCNVKSIEWCITNKIGIFPSFEVIDLAFYELSVLQYDNLNQYYWRNNKNTSKIIELIKHLTSEQVYIKLRKYIKNTGEISKHFVKVTTDIHQFSNQKIIDSSNGIHIRKSLNNSVFEYIKNKVKSLENTQTFIPKRTESELYTKIIRLIHLYFSNENIENVINKFKNILNESSLDILDTSIRFLEMFHPEYVEEWINGFLRESIEMNSCTQGALERSITGFRGINDENLEFIFAQPERKQLLLYFLKEGLNLFDENLYRKNNNIQNIVKLLKENGVTKNTSERQIQGIIENYIKNHIISLGLEVEDNFDDAKVIIEIIMDNYEKTLQIFLE